MKKNPYIGEIMGLIQWISNQAITLEIAQMLKCTTYSLYFIPPLPTSSMSGSVKKEQISFKSLEDDVLHTDCSIYISFLPKTTVDTQFLTIRSL